MLLIVADEAFVGSVLFVAALSLMAGSLACLVWEIWISGGALKILLSAMENAGQPDIPK